MTAADPISTLRRFVENLSDDAIHSLIDTLVRGILQGVVDELGDQIVDHLVDQLAAAGHTTPTAAEIPAAAAPESPAADPAPTPRAQDADRHVCEICGREGTRRYVRTDTGWKCSPTATACVGNQPGGAPEPVVDEDNLDDNGGSYKMPDGIPDEQRYEPEPPLTPETAEVNPEEGRAPRPPASAAQGITARCTGCTRTWNLHGRILTQAVDMHERKHDHIVDIEDGADA